MSRKEDMNQIAEFHERIAGVVLLIEFVLECTVKNPKWVKEIGSHKTIKGKSHHT